MDIRHYIKDLLYLHDCVVIPEFGGFVSGYQSSEIHKFRNLVYPPSKSILFNRRLQANDGILINHIVRQEKTDYRKAEETVKQFSAWWNRILENKGMVVFPEVGKLYINSANVLVFLPELRKNYLLDTFGLKPIAFHPQMEVVHARETREKISEPISEPEYAEKLRIKRKRRVLIAAAAALIGALLLLPQLFFQNLLPEKIRIEQLNIFDVYSKNEDPGIKENVKKEDPVIKKESEKIPEKIDEEKEIITEKDTVTQKNDELVNSIEAEKTVEESSNNEGNYYIILGSFEYISDAIRTKKQLDSRFGKTVEVFSSEDGKYLAGIFSGTKENAESSLGGFETTEFKPWIMARRSPL